MQTAIDNKITDQKAHSAEEVVRIEHLSKAFGTHTVLKDINLHLSKGENLIVMGKSGTGKSVLIKCMVGLMEPDSGSICIFGQSVPDLDEKELNDVRKKIGFLFQSAALYDSMTVRENLEFPLRDDKEIKSGERAKMVEEVLNNVGLLEAIDKMPSELSGGMRKRIGLARTLIQRPDIILYDEPTTGLDPITSREISHLIVDIQKKYGSAALIITHDLDCARITGNRVILLDEGLVIAEGSYDDLKDSNDERVRDFFK
ncbi:MAG: ATP-binding cassette domain-containing protein [Bacteroidetes bacterium]|nr:ATP-binding cassette domain-containing protein [Bacteroidota bacterium]